jgi:hypothetical protein
MGVCNKKGRPPNFCDVNARDPVRSRMREFESWHSSHPVRQKRESPRRPNKSPPFADFSTTANSLHVPKLAERTASSPEVSTDSLNYSRFLESPIGDYFDHEWVAQLAVLDACKLVRAAQIMVAQGTPACGQHVTNEYNGRQRRKSCFRTQHLSLASA